MEKAGIHPQMSAGLFCFLASRRSSSLMIARVSRISSLTEDLYWGIRALTVKVGSARSISPPVSSRFASTRVRMSCNCSLRLCMRLVELVSAIAVLSLVAWQPASLQPLKDRLVVVTPHAPGVGMPWASTQGIAVKR